jgi:ATP-dependent exoDNAse (exonuclease V) alpha subunit
MFPELGDAVAITGTLSKEQRKAVETLLSSRDQVLLLRGAAGAGKTFALSEIVKNARHPAIVTAPTSSATETLRKEGFPEAVTIQKLLGSDNEKSRMQGALLVIDEAGLLSTKQMESAFSVAREHGARVLLVGDTRQHNSVEAGDALRLVEDYSVVKRAEIGTISRQKEVKYREAVQRLANGEISRGFELLDRMGAVKEAKSDDRARSIAAEYGEKAQDGRNVLVVTPTWSEHRLVTDAIRTELKARGTLQGNGVMLDVFKSQNFTKVEKRYAPNFKPGLYVSFHRSRCEFKQGQIWEVEAHSDDNVTLRGADGDLRTIVPGEYSRAFDVVEKERAEFAPGDKVLLKANYASSRHNRLPNGAIQEIERITANGRISLKGGRVLEADFRHFTHGYAVTSQASQGKTADHVIVSCDSRSKMALSKNQFYVSCSRARESVSVYTDSSKQLRNAVERSSSRKLVLERVVREGILRKRGMILGVKFDRSIEMARDLVDRAFVKFRHLEKSKTRSMDHGFEVKRDKGREIESEFD